MLQPCRRAAYANVATSDRLSLLWIGVLPVKLINDLFSCPKKFYFLLPHTARSTNNDSENITYTPQLSARETDGINIHFSLLHMCKWAASVGEPVCHINGHKYIMTSHKRLPLEASPPAKDISNSNSSNSSSSRLGPLQPQLVIFMLRQLSQLATRGRDKCTRGCPA